MKHYDIKLDFETGRANVDNTFLGLKLSNGDASVIRQIRTNGIALSRLAPYLGWAEFLGQARADWDVWESVSHSISRISRVGLRCVNRIDIPARPLDPVELDEYFTVGVKIPQPPFRPMSKHFVRFESTVGDELRFDFSLNFAPVDSPILNHVSFVLDIDIYATTGLPRAADELWDFVARMRTPKNLIFEASVTDAARALFDG